MFPIRTSLKVQFIIALFAIFAGIAQAKSVYVINNINYGQLSAYRISGESLQYQADYFCESSSAVGMAINESIYGGFLFVTFEGIVKLKSLMPRQCSM